MGGSSRSSSASARCSDTAPSFLITYHETAFKHVFSTTSVRKGLSVWAKTCFQRGRSFPFLETAGAVRSKHVKIVNLLDSHRPIGESRFQESGLPCAAVRRTQKPGSVRPITCAGRRDTARVTESGSKGSGVEPRSIGPFAGATTMSARGSPPDAAGSHRHPAGAGPSARGSQRDSVPMVRTSAPHRAGSPKTRAGDGDSHPTEHETRHAR